MFEVNGLMIDANAQTILEEIRDELAHNGIFRFRTIKPGNDNVQFTCPFHGEGQEKHPSCGISVVDQRVGRKVIPAGTVHCFTCDYTSNLAEFISQCFGRIDGGMYGNQWLKKRYVSSKVVVRQPLRLDINRGRRKKAEQEQITYVSEQELDSYRYYHNYMYERGLTDEVIELFDIGYDSKRQCITMPVRDMNGGVVFVQTRSVGTKFHHYEKNVNKTDYVFGAYECVKYFPDAPYVYVCESIINALSFWCVGIPAVALMGTGGGNQYSILKSLPYRKYVAALDPDEAGDLGTKKLYKMLKNSKLVTKIKYNSNFREKGMDINDIYMQNNNFLQEFTEIGVVI